MHASVGTLASLAWRRPLDCPVLPVKVRCGNSREMVDSKQHGMAVLGGAWGAYHGLEKEAIRARAMPMPYSAQAQGVSCDPGVSWQVGC